MTLREALTNPWGPMRTHLGAVHERMGKEGAHPGMGGAKGTGTQCDVEYFWSGRLGPGYFTTMESSTLQLGLPA